MKNIHLTYANVVCTVLLVLAIGGGGVAVAAGLGKNTVGSPQLKSGAVRNADLADNAVTGAGVRDNRLTGDDIKESTLGRVPSAGRALEASQLVAAAVDAEGNLLEARSQGALGAQPITAAGDYQVTFARSLKGCAFVVTVDAHRNDLNLFTDVNATVFAVDNAERKVSVSLRRPDASFSAPFTLLGVC